jgi:ATP synthase protein I
MAGARRLGAPNFVTLNQLFALISTRLTLRPTLPSFRAEPLRDPMADREQQAQMQRLSDRIAAAKKAVEAPEVSKVEEHHSQAQLVWRMVIELVVGICIGFGMGYGLDYLLGTMPIFLVVMTLLGFAAGVRTMLRSAEELQKQAEHAQRENEDSASGG